MPSHRRDFTYRSPTYRTSRFSLRGKPAVIALRHAMRSEDDLVIRYGGEEFAVILQDADLTVARQAAERLRQVVSELKIPHPGLGPGRTVSISIGARAVAPEKSISDALTRADKRLYEAKQAGRDCVAA